MTESERSMSKMPSRGEKVGVERSLPSILKMPGVERSHASMLNPNRHIAFGGNQFQEAHAQMLQVGTQAACGLPHAALACRPPDEAHAAQAGLQGFLTAGMVWELSAGMMHRAGVPRLQPEH